MLYWTVLIYLFALFGFTVIYSSVLFRSLNKKCNSIMASVFEIEDALYCGEKEECMYCGDRGSHEICKAPSVLFRYTPVTGEDYCTRSADADTGWSVGPMCEDCREQFDGETVGEWND